MHSINHPPWHLFRRVASLGAGAHGHVYLAEGIPDRNGGLAGYFVIKRIHLEGSQEAMASAATEVRVLESLPPHVNVVRYHNHFFDSDGYVNIIMEHCPGGDLERLIRRRREASASFTVKEIIFFALQLLVGVSHLHHHGVLHRDLKPSNIMVCPTMEDVTTPIRESSTYRVAVPTTEHEARASAADPIPFDCSAVTLKIGDFGISKVLEATDASAKTVLGTPFYMAPELCESQSYGAAADVWSLGAVMFEVAANGQKCFDGNSILAVVRNVCKGIIPSMPPSVDATVRPLLAAMMTLSPQERPSAGAILRRYFSPTCPDFADYFEDPDEV